MLLRRRKILLNCLSQCENRMTMCTQKQCSLEQLEITKMQLDAIKSTSRIFKRFTSRHTVERVEQLHESMCALQEDMMDISEILEHPAVTDLDVEDELEELMAGETTDPRLIFPDVPARDRNEGESVPLATSLATPLAI